jgi:hypothetical protein
MKLKLKKTARRPARRVRAKLNGDGTMTVVKPLTKLERAVRAAEKAVGDLRALELVHDARCTQYEALTKEAKALLDQITLLKQHNHELVRYATRLGEAHEIAFGLLEHSQPAPITAYLARDADHQVRGLRG